MDEVYSIFSVFLVTFLFAIFLLGIGAWAGGDWEAVSQGFCLFIFVILGFYVGATVLFKLVWK